MELHESFSPHEIATGLALALAVGAVVGLERERRAHVAAKALFGGARTFPLVALLGALCALAVGALGPAAWIGGLLAVTGLLGVGYRLTTGRSGEGAGLTSELAALVVHVLGGLPFLPLPGTDFAERALVAGALGVAVMGLLALRRPIHAFAEQLAFEDLTATARFALIALVALPLLPDRNLDPFEVLNPFRIGVVVVLIAGIGFVGYVAMRSLGPRRGLGVTAMAGGLVSSTAVTLSFSSRAKEPDAPRRALALAIVVAATIMFGRILAEVAVIRPELVVPTAAPLGAMAAVGALGCLWSWRWATGESGDPPARLHNPFRLWQALRLGAAYVGIRLLSAVAWEQWGSEGLLASAAIAGLADVDAITISLARMHENGLSTALAVRAITTAALCNTLVKVGLVAIFGGWRLLLPVAATLLPAALAGAAVALLA